MKFLKRPQLVLVLSAFVTMFCRCGFDSGAPVTLNLSDGSTLECREFYESNPTWEAITYFYSYDCSIPCPDGSQVPAKELRLPNIEGKYNGADIVDLDLVTLQEKYCTVPAASTEPATEPASTSNGNDSVVTTAPFLTGKVTACDYKIGFINFERADDDQEYSQERVQVALNQQTVDCGVPNNNLGILSCDLPRSIRFPLNVQVQVENVQVDDFNFDGQFCGYKESNSAGGSDSGEGDQSSGGGGVPACDPHFDHSCPVDCSNPANADLCH